MDEKVAQRQGYNTLEITFSPAIRTNQDIGFEVELEDRFILITRNVSDT
jgi:hypothetical protein